MCAIFGIVERRGADPAAAIEAARAMQRALAHRGPDDWGLVALVAGRVEYWAGRALVDAPRPPGGGDGEGGLAVLGHQRLAIIDLSPAGHQPMSTPDGRLWISLNGEIYNYRALRAELEAQGVRFASRSDTEVVLALFRTAGLRALEHLRGMFAAAIWDAATETLWLVRDRFGMKPLYYACPTRDELLFASEVKALLASGRVAADPDPQAVGAFLQRGALPGTLTFYRGVAALPPGHWARWHRGTLTVEPYWSLAAALEGHWSRVAAADAAAAIEAALVDSVRAHLASDVPVGVFLSGGLDSTAVLGAVRRVYGGPLRTLTVCGAGTSDDEGALARAAARRFETDHVEIPVSAEEVLRQLDDFFDAMDEPTVDGLNTYIVARTARAAGLKVVLSGLGGDELLGGYSTFVRVPRAARWLGVARRMPGLLLGAAALLDRMPLAAGPKAADVLRTAGNGAALRGLWRAMRRLFSDREIAELAALGLPLVVPPPPEEAADLADPFATVAACEIEEFMTPQLLRDVDAFAMHWAVEVRTPFVDHLLLEAVRAAGRWRRGRAPSFKLALFRGGIALVPPGHLGQPKRGFFLAVDDWLRRALAGELPSPLTADFRAFAARPAVRPFVERFARGRLHWSRLWALYVLDRFTVSHSRWTSRSSSSTSTAERSCPRA